MKSLPILIFLLSTTLISIYADSELETVGGLTLVDWNQKCAKYFRESGDKTGEKEKAFFVPGYCEVYICQKYGTNQYGMRIEECKTRFQNGRPCKRVKNNEAQYPNCCEYVCS